MIKPREAAVNALIRWRREGSWPDLYLKQALEGMTSQDAALATNLTYGTLQRLLWLDFVIGRFSSIKLKKITPQVLDILRVSAYQLLCLDQVPDYAAVSQAVDLAKKLANPRAAGFANALLRKIAAQREALPTPDTGDWMEDASVLTSHPRWLVERFAAILGKESCLALLTANNETPTVTARVNTLQTTAAEILARLKNKKIAARPHDTLPDCLILPSAAGLGELFSKGLLYIQDAASQLCVHALDPGPGETLLDLCAAPGGKTLLAAQLMEGKGRINAADLHPHKVERMKKLAKAYGFDRMAAFSVRDAARFESGLEGVADKVICDVPCSGLGIIRKKPDIRYKSPDGLENLPQLQYDILVNAARYLKPGGALVYSTCTLLPEENQAVTDRFLETNPGYAYEGFSFPMDAGGKEGRLTLWPHLHGTDGFYIAKIRKKA